MVKGFVKIALFFGLALFLSYCFKPLTFEDIFNIAKPNNLEFINEIIIKNPNYRNYSYFGKFKGSKDSYCALTKSLKLLKAKEAYILKPLSDEVSWWKPPSFDEQIDYEYTYYISIDHKSNPELNVEIITQYHQGVIYIYKSGYN